MSTPVSGLIRTWPSNEPGNITEFIEFTTEGRTNPDTEESIETLIRWRIDVGFMLSNWECMFGECPGVLISGAMSDVGCCQIGVYISAGEEMRKLKKFVKQLTADDADFIDEIQAGRWYVKDDDAEPEERFHTIVKDGACIFANREGGSAGGIGCAFHRLAQRTGKHHSDTKPDICWQAPVAVHEEYDEDSDTTTCTVTFTPGYLWGDTDITNLHSPGWWCTETPDAFKGKTPVFRSYEVELRKQMGDEAYDKMVALLKPIAEGMWRMAPGQVVNDGRPLIPLYVKQRKALWEADGRKKSQKALERSKVYFDRHGIK